MTRKTNTSADGAAVAAGCLLFLILFPALLLLTTVIVLVAWNVGLEGAGIVDNDIGFWTALGLAFVINILRSIFNPFGTRGKDS